MFVKYSVICTKYFLLYTVAFSVGKKVITTIMKAKYDQEFWKSCNSTKIGIVVLGLPKCYWYVQECRSAKMRGALLISVSINPVSAFAKDENLLQNKNFFVVANKNFQWHASGNCLLRLQVVAKFESRVLRKSKTFLLWSIMPSKYKLKTMSVPHTLFSILHLPQI